MASIFNSENKVFTFLDKVINCVIVSLLWLAFCIPIVTIGASTTALYYTVNKVIRHGRSYLWREFWGAFKDNFKQSTLVWLILLVVSAVLGIDYYIMHGMYEAGEPLGKGYIIFAAFFVIEIMWISYIFPYIARFKNSIKETLKNSALIAIANFPKTILIFLIIAGCTIVTSIFWFLIALMPALMMWWINIILEGVFRKYMTEEDKAKEDEMNDEYPDVKHK